MHSPEVIITLLYNGLPGKIIIFPAFKVSKYAVLLKWNHYLNITLSNERVFLVPIDQFTWEAIQYLC